MKTLDEVIWAVENCDSAIDDCAHCAYYKEDCENLRPLRADALHYLKVLQKMQKAQPLEKSEWNELYNWLMRRSRRSRGRNKKALLSRT